MTNREERERQQQARRQALLAAQREALLHAFGSNVRWHRHRLKLSQEQLAAIAGLHWTYIGQIERGERNLTLFNIFRLSRALDLSAGDLIEGSSNVDGDAFRYVRPPGHPDRR